MKDRLTPRRKKGELRSFEKTAGAPRDGTTRRESEGQLSFGFPLPEKKPEHANPLWWLAESK